MAYFASRPPCLRPRPMPARPEAVYIPSWDLPEAPRPLDPGAFFEALAASFVPDPGRSWEQARRYQHADLGDMRPGQLWRERRQCEDLLTWLPERDPRLAWLGERLTALTSEEQRRAKHGQVDFGRSVHPGATEHPTGEQRPAAGRPQAARAARHQAA